MFDPEAIAIAREALESELPRRRQRFHEEIARVQSEAAMRGLAQSSALLGMVADVCATEIESSAERVWQVVHRNITVTGVEPSDDLATDLKRRVDDLLTPYCFADPQVKFEEVRKLNGMSEVVAAWTGLHARTMAARRRIFSEIDLFARSLRNQADARKQKGSGGGPLFQFYGPVAAVQTGEHAQAHVTQNFDTAVRQELLDALRRIEEQLDRANDVGAEQAQEVRDVVEDTKRELEKSKPSRFLLLPKLQAVAQAIQTVKTLAGAYEAFKAILAAHGIQLP